MIGAGNMGTRKTERLQCAQAKQLFSPYLDGAVTGTQMLALQDHLSACEACHEEYQELQQANIGPSDAGPDSAAVQHYVAMRGEELGRGLTLEVDGRRVALHLDSSRVIFPPGAGGLPTMKMGFLYDAPYPSMRPGAALVEHQQVRALGIVAAADERNVALARHDAALEQDLRGAGLRARRTHL